MAVVPDEEISLGAVLFPPFINGRKANQCSDWNIGCFGLSYDAMKFVLEGIRSIRPRLDLYDSFGVTDTINQRKQKLCTTPSQKFLMTLYVLFAMIMLTLYKSFFVKLTFPVSRTALSTEFDTLNKVAAKLKLGYKFLAGTSAHNNLFTNHSEEVLRKSFVEADLLPHIPNQNRTIKELVAYTMARKGTIMAYPAATLLYEKRALGYLSDRLYFVIDKRDTSYVTAIVKKNFFTKTELLKIQLQIYRLNEYGFFTHFSRLYRTDPTTIRSDQYDQALPIDAVRMNMDLFISFSTVLLIGYVFATLILFIEKIVKKFNK